MRTIEPGRVTRAAEALAEGRVEIEPGPEPGTYDVQSFSGGQTYRVTLAPERSCTCPDAAFHRAVTCKHMAAVLLARKAEDR